MKKIVLIILSAQLAFSAYSQNIFPVKLSNCETSKFCLDCGDTKVSFDDKSFTELITKLNETLNLIGVKGNVKFQVLVDSVGRGCVLSHTDQSKNVITKKIIKEVNKYTKWNPAITEGKKEEKTSIILVFTISDNKISGKIERVDMEAIKKSFDKPVNPKIYNKSYIYKNENLSNYKMTVWNSKNSNLPNNMNDIISIDQDDLIWLSIDGGLVTFNGIDFKITEQNITEKGKFTYYNAIATDNNNTKWMFNSNLIYSYDNSNWTKYDSTVTGIPRVFEIINNQNTGEVFFCTPKGLVIYNNGKWSTINKENTELPSDRVAFAKRDSKNRLWIGTYDGGSAMIDTNGVITNFENSKTILKGKCITSMTEDMNGNLYFSLYEFDRKDTKKENNDEGIAIRYSDGTFKQFTTDNSGMPFNHTTCVLYDKTENVLWISTDRAGLVRFDLIDTWENYHNENSNIPTSYISSMAFDKKGNLFLATRQGLVKIERKL